MDAFPLVSANLEECNLLPAQIDRLCALIEQHIAEGRYPGAQIAMARHGKLAVARTFGQAMAAPEPVTARPDTLWLLYSNTKPLTAAGMWLLAEEGALSFSDKVADHIPEFARNAKGDVTLLQLLTHRAGFPMSAMPPSAWEDHDELRRRVCDFALEWAPGSRCVYHASSAHWTAAVVIEQLTGKDYREFLRDRLIAPLGLGDELFVGVPPSQDARCAYMYQMAGATMERDPRDCTRAFRAAGIPGGGAFGTARAMAAFYQMLLNGGELGGKRIFSPRMLDYAIRDWTNGMKDGEFFVHRGIGPYLRGDREPRHNFGSIASPRTFGHEGAGSSICWADPESGVSFAYVSNCRQVDPWHGRRMDLISSLAHAAIV
jgi:CubicO group peptidase (beta-lactamase class C family)